MAYDDEPECGIIPMPSTKLLARVYFDALGEDAEQFEREFFAL